MALGRFYTIPLEGEQLNIMESFCFSLISMERMC